MRKGAAYSGKNKVSLIVITGYFNIKVRHKDNTPNSRKKRKKTRPVWFSLASARVFVLFQANITNWFMT